MPGKLSARYEVKKSWLAVYLCLFLAAGFLFFCRLLNLLDPEIRLLPECILSHATNFSLSLLVLLAFGFAVLVFGGGMKAVTVAGLLLALVNVGYELVFPLLNKPDPADAVSGLAGIALAYGFILFLKKNGLQPGSCTKKEEKR